MEIYGEYLFLENAAAGFLLLLLTGKFAGRNPGRLPMAIGSLMCGGYSFMIFLRTAAWVIILCDILFSLVLTRIVFFPIGAGKKTAAVSGSPQSTSSRIDRQNIGLLIRTCCIFYVISFLAAGITISLLAFGSKPSVQCGSGIYSASPTYLSITVGLAATYIIGRSLFSFMRKRVTLDKAVKTVTLRLGQNSWQLKGIIDTGNTLKDPMFGLPVNVLSRTEGLRILAEGNIPPQNIISLPFVGVGSGEDLLSGFYIEKIQIEGTVLRNQVIAVGKSDFSDYGDGIKPDILLNQNTLEATYGYVK